MTALRTAAALVGVVAITSACVPTQAPQTSSGPSRTGRTWSAAREGATKPPGAHPRGVGEEPVAPGNPVSLPPLPAVDGSGPVLPVYPRSVVSATSSTSNSTQPTLSSGITTGSVTFSLMPLVPFTTASALDWSAAKRYSVGSSTYRVPASAGLVDGGSYLWMAQSGAASVMGPYAFSVDLSAASTQSSDGSGAVQVALATGFAHWTWTSHTMEAASGSIGVGLDYSPANTGWPGTPTGWRLVAPSAVGYDQLVVGKSAKGSITTVRVHSKNNSWITYVPNANGYFQPLYDARGSSAPSGMYGVLAQNADGTWSLTAPTKAVTTFGVPDNQGVAWISSATSTGQASIEQQYDGASGRMTGLVDPVSGRSVQVSYGGSSDCPTFTGFVAAPDGMVCRITFWDGTTSGFGYVTAGATTTLGRLVDYPEAGAQGAAVTDVGYDAAGRLASVRSPLVAQAAASPEAGAVTGSDPAAPHLLTQVTYDAQGRVASVTDPAASLGATRVGASYAYDQTSSTPSSTVTSTPGGHVSVTTYDPVSLRTVKTTSDGLITSTSTFDARGNPTRTTDALGAATTYTYDASGAITNRTGPYTPAGNSSGAPSVTYGYDTSYTAWAPGDPNPGGTGTALLGLDVQYWAGSAWQGAPAAEELGPLSSGSAALWGPTSVFSTTWTASPVPGSSTWSARMIGTLTVPSAASGDPSKPDVYRFALNGPNKPSLWIDQVRCVVADPAYNCSSSGVPLAPGPHQVRIDMWADQSTSNPSLQLQWGRNTTNLTTVPAQMLDGGSKLNVITPGYHLTTSTTNADAIDVSGAVAAMWNRTSYVAPQLGQVYQVWNGAGLATTSMYDGASALSHRSLGSAAAGDVPPRPSGTVLPGGAATGIAYWGARETAASGCDGQVEQPQLGRPKSVSQPAPSDGAPTGVTTTSWYMADGSLAAAQTAGGPLVCLAYDAAMRVVRTSQQGGTGNAELVVDYAVGGNPLAQSTTSTVTHDGTTTTLASSTVVDLGGRTVRHVDGWGTTQQTEYGSNGLPATVTTTTAAGYTTVQELTYDPVGNLVRTQVTDSLNGTAVLVGATATYDAAGRLLTAAYSNGMSLTAGYTPYEELGSYTWTTADGAAWTSTSGYSRAGRVLTAAAAGGGHSASYAYVYDQAARLASAALTTDVAGAAHRWAYQYDADSNRTKQTLDGSRSVTYAYDKADRLLNVTGDPALSGPVTYDARGSIATIGPLTLGYDDNGLIDTIADSAKGSTVAFSYDAAGSAVAKSTTSSGTTTTDRYSAGNLILDTSGAARFQEVLLPGGITVQRTVGALSALRSSARPTERSTAGKAAAKGSPSTAPGQTWLMPGLSGATLFSADGSGLPTSGLTLYSPFGELLTAPAGGTDPALPQRGWGGAAGFETESLSTEVVPMGARLYLPALGRFAQVDAQAGGSANNYDYVSQDPVNGTDPTGAQAWWKYLCAFLAVVVLTVATAGAAAVANAAIAVTMAAMSTVAATMVGVAVGVVIGAAGAAAVYASNTFIMGNTWSWTGFAVAVGIGAVMGGYNGYSGVSTIGKAVTSVTQDAAPEGTGAWAGVKRLYASVKQSVMGFLGSPPQAAYDFVAQGRSNSFVMEVGGDLPSMKTSIAAKVARSATCVSVAKAVVSAPISNGVPSGFGTLLDIQGYADKAIGYVAGNYASRAFCGM